MDHNILTKIDSIKNDIDKLNADASRFNVYKLDNFVENKNIDEIVANISPEEFLGNIDNILELHTTIISREQRIRDILRYHMNNTNITHNTNLNTLDDAALLVKTILDTYHYRAGGYNFEDCVWNMHKQTSKLFKVDEGSIIFSNSIAETLLYDVESFRFLTDLVKFIRRHLGDKYRVKWQKINDIHRETWWVLITVSDTE
jgi:hypothetical protein